MRSNATFVPTKWDEKPYEQTSTGTKSTKASVEYAFKGDLEGQGLVEYLMFYRHVDASDPHKSEATYVGLTRFRGKLNGKAGSFVTEDRGTFEGGVASTVSVVIPGSGTEELQGISGTAKCVATPTSCSYEIDFEFD